MDAHREPFAEADGHLARAIRVTAASLLVYGIAFHALRGLALFVADNRFWIREVLFGLTTYGTAAVILALVVRVWMKPFLLRGQASPRWLHAAAVLLLFAGMAAVDLALLPFTAPGIALPLMVAVNVVFLPATVVLAYLIATITLRAYPIAFRSSALKGRLPATRRRMQSQRDRVVRATLVQGVISELLERLETSVRTAPDADRLLVDAAEFLRGITLHMDAPASLVRDELQLASRWCRVALPDAPPAMAVPPGQDDLAVPSLAVFGLIAETVQKAGGARLDTVRVTVTESGDALVLACEAAGEGVAVRNAVTAARDEGEVADREATPLHLGRPRTWARAHRLDAKTILAGGAAWTLLVTVYHTVALVAFPQLADRYTWRCDAFGWGLWALAAPFLYQQGKAAAMRSGSVAAHVAPLFAGSAAVAVAVQFICAMTIHLGQLIVQQNDTPKGILVATLAGDLDVFFLAGMLVSAGAFTIVTDRRARAEELRRVRLQRAIRMSQLALLSAILKPHFLYNSLALVSAIADENRARAAEFTRRLAGYYGRCDRATRRRLVDLGHELELLRDYAELAGEYAAQPAVIRAQLPAAAERALVPPMLLQPLADNAVRHVIAAGGRREISIRAAVGGGSVTIEMENPVRPGAATRSRIGTGKGLNIARERLRLLYGANASLEAARQGERFVARVVLPYVTA